LSSARAGEREASCANFGVAVWDNRGKSKRRLKTTLVLDDGTPDRAVSKTVFDNISRAELAEDIGQIDNHEDDQYFQGAARPASPVAG
jgi:hypothetical protein